MLGNTLTVEEQRNALFMRSMQRRRRAEEENNQQKMQISAAQKAREIAAEKFDLHLSPDDPLVKLLASEDVIFQSFQQSQTELMNKFKSRLEEAITRSRKQAESEAIDLLNLLLTRVSNEMTNGSTEAIKALEKSLWSSANSYVGTMQSSEQSLAALVNSMRQEIESLKKQLAAAAWFALAVAAASVLSLVAVILHWA